MAFDRWQHQLYDVLAVVVAKQQQYDQAVGACQQLLKPWPRKTNVSETALKRDIPNTNSNEVCPREETELRVVNDLLRKAHTTMKLKQQTQPGQDDLPTSKSRKELWEMCDSEARNAQETQVKPAAEPPDVQTATVVKTNVNKIKDDVKKSVAITYSEQPLKKTGNQQNAQSVHESKGQSFSRSGQSSHLGQRAVNSNGKSLTAFTECKRPKSRENSQPLTFVESKVKSRPLSSKSCRRPSRPGSGIGRFKPAHTVAPFKTDPTLRVPRCSVNNGMVRPPLKHHTTWRHFNTVRADRNRVLPPISCDERLSPTMLVASGSGGGGDGEGVQSDCEAGSVPYSNGESQLLLPQQSSSGGEETVSRLPSAHQTNSCSQETKKKLTNTHQTSLVPEDPLSPSGSLGLQSAPGQASSGHVSTCSDNSDGSISCSVPAEEQNNKLFSLLTEGRYVTIPSRVRHIFARNQQLRDSVTKQRPCRTQRDTEGDPGLMFAHRLDHTNEAEEELHCRWQCLRCLCSHQQLTMLLTHLRLDTITESSSAEDVLRAKRLAEFVLSSFSELSDRASKLSKVEFGSTPAIVEPSLPQRQHPYLWIPATLSGNIVMCEADRLVYRNKAELSRYLSEMLRVQSLVCEHHLLGILVSDVLPWLEQQDLNCLQDFGTIFRELFSLLTSDGSHGPVLIRDPL